MKLERKEEIVGSRQFKSEVNEVDNDIVGWRQRESELTIECKCALTSL